MSIDRLEIMQKVLKQLGVEVWNSLRYANNTGTCLRCVSGPMVMVPDDASQPYFFQAEGAEELKAKVEPLFDVFAAEAADAIKAGGPRAALLAAADALYQQGYDAGYEAALVSAREVFEKVVTAKYGALPPSVSSRIHEGSFEDMARWATRMPHTQHATALIV